VTRPEHPDLPSADGARRAEPDPVDLDAEDAFGHPAVPDPARDDAVWPDGDEDDLDV
jgi:hypothetical protein